MEDYRLDIYDTTRFAYNPKDKNFFIKISKFPEFQLTELGKDRPKYIVYITLMYDKYSDIRLNTEMTYWQKKKTAAVSAGFNLNKDNRFNEDVENILLSNNKQFLDAVVRYLQFQHMPEFTQLCLYEMLHDIIWKKAITDQETKLLKEATQLTQTIFDLEKMIYGGNELITAKEALYEKVGSLELGIRAEDIARKIEKGESFTEFSKYGDYIPETLEYYGEKDG